MLHKPLEIQKSQNFANVDIDNTKTVIKFSKTHPMFSELNSRFSKVHDFEDAMSEVAIGIKSQKQWLVVKLENSILNLEDGINNFCFNWNHLDSKEYGAFNSLQREQIKDFLKFVVSGFAYYSGESCYCPDVPPVRTMLTEEAVFEIPAKQASFDKELLTVFGNYGATEATKRVLFADNPSDIRDGLGWWTILAILALDIYSNTTSSLLERISNALELPSKLDTGYRLSALVQHIVSIDEGCQLTKDNQLVLTEEMLKSFDKRVKLFLLEKNGNKVSFNDVGSGICQVIPVLVAIYSQQLVYLHQPELHLHPRLQAQLADVLIDCIKPKLEKTIFIETHSEHLLLRILKRIRQTNDGAAIPAELQLLPNQVSVIYVDRDEEHGTTFKPLRISRTGEFMDRWPHGFFAEREQELFDE